MRDQVPQPYKATDKIIVLYISVKSASAPYFEPVEFSPHLHTIFFCYHFDVSDIDLVGINAI
jgi:hypothetical protein